MCCSDMASEVCQVAKDSEEGREEEGKGLINYSRSKKRTLKSGHIVVRYGGHGARVCLMGRGAPPPPNQM